MTALQLIKKCATLINVAEILEDNSLDELQKENEESVLENNFALSRMFEILTILMDDIAYDYAPVMKEKTVTSSDKKILLNEFANLIKICGVKKDGFNIHYKIVNDAINTDFDGEFSVGYMVRPNIESLLDEVDVYGGVVGCDLLVFGLASLYCLAVGLFEEFNTYNSIYTEKLSAIKNLKIINMPCRRWE